MAISTVRALIKGAWHNLEIDSDGYYSLEMPAGSESSFLENGGYFPIEIEAIDNSDTPLTSKVDVDDPTFGNKLKLFVFEDKAPEITIVAPGEGSYLIGDAKPTIKFTVVDNKTMETGFSGINLDSIVLKINDVTVDKDKVALELSSDKATCTGTYTPETDLENGVYEIKVEASDNDGNTANPATRSFEIDVQAPGLEINEPVSGFITSNSVIDFKATVTEKNGPVTVTVRVNDGEPKNIVLSSGGGVIEEKLTLTARNNAIKVTATDYAGNRTTEQTIYVTYNSTAPTFETVEILYNGAQVSASNKVPTTGSYKIRCKVTTEI